MPHREHNERNGDVHYALFNFKQKNSPCFLKEKCPQLLVESELKKAATSGIFPSLRQPYRLANFLSTITK
jgi:hypothetical protein